jgi:hypothetical protein
MFKVARRGLYMLTITFMCTASVLVLRFMGRPEPALVFYQDLFPGQTISGDALASFNCDIRPIDRSLEICESVSEPDNSALLHVTIERGIVERFTLFPPDDWISAGELYLLCDVPIVRATGGFRCRWGSLSLAVWLDTSSDAVYHRLPVHQITLDI